jgi:UDP-N-acetylglucosamine 2-epimerase (non-hydrolysing)
LERLVEVLAAVCSRLPLVFPVHARTRARLETFGLLERCGTLQLTDPLGYLDFLALLAQSRVVLTDSGGIQEETTVLGVPCLTLRKNTERPVTIWEGTNRLVDPDDPAAISGALAQTLAGDAQAGSGRPELWDGSASDRIVQVFVEWFGAFSC